MMFQNPIDQRSGDGRFTVAACDGFVFRNSNARGVSPLNYGKNREANS